MCSAAWLLDHSSLLETLRVLAHITSTLCPEMLSDLHNSSVEEPAIDKCLYMLNLLPLSPCPVHTSFSRLLTLDEKREGKINVLGKHAYHVIVFRQEHNLTEGCGRCCCLQSMQMKWYLNQWKAILFELLLHLRAYVYRHKEMHITLLIVKPKAEISVKSDKNEIRINAHSLNCLHNCWWLES